MRKSIFGKTLWERRKSIAFWNLGIFLYTLMMGALYNSIDGVEEFANIMEEMPEVMQALMGEVGDITTPAGFLSAELYSLTLPLVFAIFAIGYGASTLSKEEDSGTLELLLSSPLKRSTIVIQKVLSLIAATVLLGLTVWLGVTVATLVLGLDIGLMRVLWASLAASLLALSFGSLALAITSQTARRGLAISASVVLFIWSYFATTVANLVDNTEWLRNTSLLHFYDGSNILTDGLSVQKVSVLVLFIIIMICLSVALFNRRDTGS